MGFIYASAHVRDVDGEDLIEDGRTPVDIDAGFEVAPGDASDIEVANAHYWGSWGAVIFSDGRVAQNLTHCAYEPRYKGIQRSILACEILFYNLMMISGGKWGSGDHLIVDSQGRVSARDREDDVLLRKRA